MMTTVIAPTAELTQTLSAQTVLPVQMGSVMIAEGNQQTIAATFPVECVCDSTAETCYAKIHKPIKVYANKEEPARNRHERRRNAALNRRKR